MKTYEDVFVVDFWSSVNVWNDLEIWPQKPNSESQPFYIRSMQRPRLELVTSYLTWPGHNR